MLYSWTLSYKTAPLEVRERFSPDEEGARCFLGRLAENPLIDGAAGIFTCNRSEVYISCRTHRPPAIPSLAPYIRRYTEEEAARHLFRVAAGLDSAVLGEDEILRQVKDAFEFSHREGFTDRDLNILFREAAAWAKEVKTKTRLSNVPVSSATIAANLAAAQKPQLVLVIGASGHIGSSVAKNIAAKGIAVVGTGTGRHRLAGADVKMVDYRERFSYMERADVVVSATKSPHYTVTAAALMGKRVPGLFIDMAVPRDIDPEVGSLSRLVDIDEFRTEIGENEELRRAAAEDAGERAEAAAGEAMKKIELSRYLAQGYRPPFDMRILYELRDKAELGEFRATLAALRRL